MNAWAIKNPQGRIVGVSLYSSEADAWQRYMGLEYPKLLSTYKSHGYRAVPVQITELNAPPQTPSPATDGPDLVGGQVSTSAEGAPNEINK